MKTISTFRATNLFTSSCDHDVFGHAWVTHRSFTSGRRQTLGLQTEATEAYLTISNAALELCCKKKSLAESHPWLLMERVCTPSLSFMKATIDHFDVFITPSQVRCPPHLSLLEADLVPPIFQGRKCLFHLLQTQYVSSTSSRADLEV